MNQPPYSPDFALSDFWLFVQIKKRLPTQPNAESLFDEITDLVNLIPKNDDKKTFEKWKDRMELCIKYKGEQFEHKIKKI